jgi:hypothetical protein
MDKEDKLAELIKAAEQAEKDMAEEQEVIVDESVCDLDDDECLACGS